MAFDLGEYLTSRSLVVNEALQRFMPASDSFPPVLREAMLYSINAGGKRLRPILTFAAAEAVGGNLDLVIPAACALECIHTYSLIHDDLPVMDNDDLRRGKPTSHKVYGEAMAMLAGDGLLTHAFALLAQQSLGRVPAERVLQAIGEIALAAGPQGMVAGQAADILSERGKLNSKPEAVLHFIHAHKTGALLSASVRAGAIIAGASIDQLKALTKYATLLGLAFQITDDLLDVCGEETKAGKRVGKDAELGKLTYPGLYGIDESLRKNQELLQAALLQLSWFGREADPLRAIAEYLVKRDH